MATQKPTTFMLGKGGQIRTLSWCCWCWLAWAMHYGFLSTFKVSHTHYQMTERANYNPYYASQLLINEA